MLSPVSSTGVPSCASPSARSPWPAAPPGPSPSLPSTSTYSNPSTIATATREAISLFAPSPTCSATGLRRTDLIARLGGEEFAVVLPETNFSGAVHIAEKLRDRLASTPIALPTGEYPGYLYRRGRSDDQLGCELRLHHATRRHGSVSGQSRRPQLRHHRRAAWLAQPRSLRHQTYAPKRSALAPGQGNPFVRLLPSPVL